MVGGGGDIKVKCFQISIKCEIYIYERIQKCVNFRGIFGALRKKNC